MNMKEREWEEEAERIYQEAEADPMAVGILPPEDMRERLLMGVRKLEEENARERLSEEDKELLYLGRLYKKKRKQKKYFVLAAAVVMALAIGITSVGGTEKIFGVFKRDVADRTQTGVDSEDNTKFLASVDEEEVYQKVEEKFNFIPVKLEYLPEGTEFQEATVYEELQGIYMVYGKEDKADILYLIRPNYRDSSWGKDIEDKLLEEYEIEISNTEIRMKKYLVENEKIRWIGSFTYDDASYSLMLFEMQKEEVENIIQNLYFPE